jgi:hypothetical protein
MGSTIAIACSLIILIGVCIYLFGIQTAPAPLPVLRAADVMNRARRNPINIAARMHSDPLHADRAVPGLRDPDQQLQDAQGDLPRRWRCPTSRKLSR